MAPCACQLTLRGLIRCLVRGRIARVISSDDCCVAFVDTPGPPGGLVGLLPGIMVVPGNLGRTVKDGNAREILHKLSIDAYRTQMLAPGRREGVDNHGLAPRSRLP